MSATQEFGNTNHLEIVSMLIPVRAHDALKKMCDSWSGSGFFFLQDGMVDPIADALQWHVHAHVEVRPGFRLTSWHESLVARRLGVQDTPSL